MYILEVIFLARVAGSTIKLLSISFSVILYRYLYIPTGIIGRNLTHDECSCRQTCYVVVIFLGLESYNKVKNKMYKQWR